MSLWFLALVAVIYVAACVSLLAEGKVGLAVFCLGCIVGNVGLVLAAMGY